MQVDGRVSVGIDRRCDGVWDCRKVAYEPGIAIDLVHGSKAEVTEAGSKVGKSIVDRDSDAETALHYFLEFITDKGSGLTCGYRGVGTFVDG